jgi:hypothetical protein
MKRQHCSKGLYVAIGFTDEARKEVQRTLQEGGLEIILMTVAEILHNEMNH